MTVSIADFWKVAADSGALSPAKCDELAQTFAELEDASPAADARRLAQWLVREDYLTGYQTSVFLAGRSGPFVFGGYRVFDRLDSGRLAGLFRAVEIASGQRVLLYFFKANQSPGGLAARMKAAAAVRHKHLSEVYRLVEQSPQSFAVVEDLHGRSVAEQYANARPTPVQTASLGAQTAQGLAQLHADGLAHGCVCPANLWLEESGNLRLLQFPLSADLRFSHGDRPAMGYLAPELVSSSNAPDAHSDIYSLGCVLFELLSGRTPSAAVAYANRDGAQAAAPRTADDWVLLLERQATVPRAVASVVGRMLETDRELRYASAKEVAQALAGYVRDAAARRQSKAQGAGGAAARSLHPDAKIAASFKSLAEEPASAARPQGEAAVPAKAQTKAAPVKTGANKTSASKPAANQTASKTADKVTAKAAAQTAARPAAQDSAAGAISVAVDGESESSEEFPLIQVDTGPAPVATLSAGTRRKKSGWQKNQVAIGLGAAGLVVVGLALVMGGFFDSAPPPAPTNVATNGSGEPEEPVPTQAAPANEPEPAAPVQEKTPAPKEPAAPTVKPVPKKVPAPKPAVNLVDDDGKTFWASPTAGEQLSFAYLPAGAELYLALRPKEILASSEGARAVAALGPGGEWARAQLEAVVGQPLGGIEQMIVAFYPQPSGAAKVAVVLHAAEKLDETALLEKFGNPTAAESSDKKKYFKGGAHAYYFPEDQPNTLVIAPPEEIADAIDSDPAPRRVIEQLLSASDAQRHVNVVTAPGALLRSGRTLLSGNLERLHGPLLWFFGDSVDAALLSCQFGDDFFVELRAVGSLDEDAFRLAERFREQLAEIPGSVESYVVGLNPQPYGRLVLFRFPQMIRALAAHTRVAAEDKQSVLRCYLPAIAGHNVALGVELALAERPGKAAAAKPVAAKPVTAAEALKTKMTLVFDKESFESTVQLISKEIDVEIELLGKDLELDGITRNQPITKVDEKDKTAGEILRNVMKKANPDGKLVYIIKAKNPGGKEAILITTRAQAAKRKDTLPAELAEPEAPK